MSENKGKQLFDEIKMLCSEYDAKIFGTQAYWQNGDFKIEIKIENKK